MASKTKKSCRPQPLIHHNPEKDVQQRFSRPWKSSDLVLKVADREFHVHRAVLIPCSPVFETMLSSNFKETSAAKIPLPGKDATEKEQLLQGIYPDQDLLISKENCIALLKLSTEYQIDRMKTRCEEYINYWCKKYMTGDEAMEVLILSQKYPLEESVVQSCVKKFVSQENQAWVEIQEHKNYSELEPAFIKRLAEERMNYLERRLKVGSKAHKEQQHAIEMREREQYWLEKARLLKEEQCFRV